MVNIPPKLTEEITKYKREFVALEQNNIRLTEAIKLQSEARNGVESALRHEVAVHYSLSTTCVVTR